MREAGQLRWFRVRSPRSLIAIIEVSHRSSADLTSDYSAILMEYLRMNRKRDKMSGFGRRRRYGRLEIPRKISSVTVLRFAF
jgi:hypothetical protein